MEAFNLKPSIIEYFPPMYIIDDINKNSEEKGTNQRFQEMLADDWDTELLPFIYNLVDTVYAENTPDKFVPYIEYYWGIIDPIIEDMDIRRKILKYIPKIYQTKGTLTSYEIVFKILGFTSVFIEELQQETGFDSPLLFDDEQRRFDRNECQTCSKYNLHLGGNLQISETFYNSIIKAIAFVEPINAKLNSIIYNDNLVTFAIFVDVNGDLQYSALNSSTDIYLKDNGDIVIVDAKAQSYFIDNGNLLQNGN